MTGAARGEVDPSFWRGRRVLVTGHTGFKGSWLSVWLESMGAEVFGLALEPPTNPSMFDALALSTRVHHRVGDVRDLAVVDAAFAEAKPEVLFHLAAQPLVRQSYVTPVETYAVNVMGTVHVLDAARRAPSLRAAVMVTSDKCYENREWAWGYRENEPMGGHDPYSNSKGCAELVISAYRRSFFSGAGMPAIASARAGNVLGGGDWSADRLVPDAMRAIAGGRAVAIRNPASVRPWQHVIEPLRGYLLLAQSCVERGGAFSDGWNFGPSDDDAVPVSTLMDVAVRCWGGAARWEHVGPAVVPHEARRLKLDCSKARADLGWIPRVRLAECLDLTVSWYRRFHDGAKADELYTLTRAQIARHGMPA